MDRRHPHAGRMALWGGRVLGLDEDVSDLDAVQTVDLGGRTVLPGFIDAHTHLAWQGVDLAAVDISQASSVGDALAIIGDAAQAATGRWVEVRGYDQRALGRHLAAADLEAVAHGREIFVTHLSGHGTVVNTAVLESISNKASLADTPGVVRDAAGVPTGLFMEMAQSVVREHRGAHTVGEVIDAIRRSAALCASQGVTYCAEAGVGGGMISLSPIEAAAYQHLAAVDELPIRVQLMVAGAIMHSLEGAATDDPRFGVELGLHSGFGGSTLGLGAAKFWLDGGMSARTAALTEPYVDGGVGELAADVQACREAAAAAYGAGWQLALHAIGDRAVDTALEIIESAQARFGSRSRRPRIEHAGLVRPDQLDRMASCGAIPVLQHAFLSEFGDDYAGIVGSRRAEWLYRGRSFLEHGIPIAASSDRPVTTGAPMAAVAFMVTRKAHSGLIIGGNEALSVEEALYAHTAGAAFACGVEAELGSLSPGKWADAVVLDDDPTAIAPEALGKVQVLATLMGGKASFDHGGIFADCPR